MNPLVMLLNTFLRCVKEGKLALVLDYPEGNPIRPLLVAKVAAMEKSAKGVEAMIRGGDTSGLQEGLNDLVEALNNIAVGVPSIAESIFVERAAMIALRERAKSLDEILALPDRLNLYPNNRFDVN